MHRPLQGGSPERNRPLTSWVVCTQYICAGLRGKRVRGSPRGSRCPRNCDRGVCAPICHWDPYRGCREGWAQIVIREPGDLPMLGRSVAGRGVSEADGDAHFRAFSVVSGIMSLVTENLCPKIYYAGFPFPQCRWRWLPSQQTRRTDM